MKYLIHFSQQHESFWLPELDTLLELNGVEPAAAYDHDTAWAIVSRGHKTSPFLVVEVPSEEVIVAVAARAILIRKVLELWGEGDTPEEAAEAVKKFPEEIKRPFFAEDVTWSVTVGSAGYSVKLQEQERLRMVFSFLPFEGRVRLRNPQHLFQVFGDYESEDEYREGRLPEHVYFGREVAQGNRDMVAAFDLKKRPYLGPTSMDNELALVMANMALVGKGKLCFDPFVGTGSILVACAHFGGVCVGTDIDVRVLKGKKGRSVFTNFDKYGLPRPELVRSDNALYGRHFRVMELYDCIVTDPPYGIRAGARKSGREGEARIVKPEERFDHMPHTQHYPVEDVLVDLLEVAAQTLVLGGRLCYLLASTWEFDLQRDLPRHPCLELSHHSMQGLTQLLCRRLITMTKTCRYDPLRREEYIAACHLHQTSGGRGSAFAAAAAAAAAEEDGGSRQRQQQQQEGEVNSRTPPPAPGAAGTAVGASGGNAAAAAAAADGLASVLPRERTKQMTRRGELTSGNVWYAAMRNSQGGGGASGGGGSGSSPSNATSSHGRQTTSNIESSG
ncbi:unnamed protein product, partial [Ectocarpus sp. 6 AP-2014]